MRTTLVRTFVALALVAPAALAQERVPTDDEATALVNAGRFAEAAEAFEQRCEADPTDARAHHMYGYSLHVAGDLDAAHDAHIYAARFPQFTATALYNHACVHALKGEKDAAFTALREALAAGFDSLDQLRGDPDMDELRSDGRFHAILLELEGASPADLASLPPARRFDFFVGHWMRRNGDQVERTLDVRSTFDGNGLIVASYDPRTGRNTDNSFLMFDEDDGTWRQVWISHDGTAILLNGGYQDGAMVLEQVAQDGKPKRGARAVYTNVSPNGFTYQWQTSIDGGRTWETAATRVFTRTEA